jgi:hypothetical protein
MSHLRALRSLNLVFAFLCSLGSLFGLAFVVAGLAQWGTDAKGAAMFILFGSISLGFFTLFAAIHLYVWFALGKGQGRIAQAMLAIFQLCNFPLGTAFGVYALWVCFFNEETARFFQDGSRAGGY